jgi:hypothetical protein
MRATGCRGLPLRGVRHSQAFFWLWVYTAPKHYPRPPTGRYPVKNTQGLRKPLGTSFANCELNEPTHYREFNLSIIRQHLQGEYHENNYNPILVDDDINA